MLNVRGGAGYLIKFRWEHVGRDMSNVDNGFQPLLVVKHGAPGLDLPDVGAKLGLVLLVWMKEFF